VNLLRVQGKLFFAPGKFVRIFPGSKERVKSMKGAAEIGRAIGPGFLLKGNKMASRFGPFFFRKPDLAEVLGRCVSDKKAGRGREPDRTTGRGPDGAGHNRIDAGFRRKKELDLPMDPWISFIIVRPSGAGPNGFRPSRLTAGVRCSRC